MNDVKNGNGILYCERVISQVEEKKRRKADLDKEKSERTGINNITTRTKMTFLRNKTRGKLGSKPKRTRTYKQNEFK